ncbi:fungal hydrophobin [Cubamyces sp. BRFM 1775]|nr:fungal hydrophobin [Cubamyces sp. BRFM 1775]
MFARLAAIAALALPLLVVAQECNTGSLECCQALEDTDSPAGSAILALLNLNLQDVIGQIGLECIPINIIGVGAGNQCTAQPVCCSSNDVGGVASIGCIPVQI